VSSVPPHDLAITRAEFPANRVPEILRSKHKLRIVWDLRHGSRRFGEIRRKLSSGGAETKAVAPRVLSRELKFLVAWRLIKRTAYAEIPQRVEYRLTSLGRSLLPVISTILEWAKRHPWHRQLAREVSSVRSGSDCSTQICA